MIMLTLFTLPLGAQRSFEPVDSGKVIRFQAGGVVARGRLLAPLTATSDSVAYCRFPGPPCQQPIAAVQLGQLRPATLEHLEVQVGNKAVKGAWIGGVVGTVFTFVGIVVASGFCEYDCPSDTDLAFRAVVSVGVWSSLGALIGSGSPRMERRF